MTDHPSENPPWLDTMISARDQEDVDAVLIEAYTKEYPRGITFCGVVFADRRGMFPDGSSIETGYIVDMPDNDRGIIRTETSSYLAVPRLAMVTLQ